MQCVGMITDLRREQVTANKPEEATGVSCKGKEWSEGNEQIIKELR